MRKRIIERDADHFSPAEQQWINLERLAQVEITSEDPAHPIESALSLSAGTGWRAAQPGEQTIRLLFDEPLRIKHIRLVFHEDRHPRTQEFALRLSADGGHSYQHIVRQQYTFSPPGTTQETEDYTADLVGVTALELRIVPDISGGDVRASLAALRIA